MTLKTITGVPEKLFLCLLLPVLFWSSGVFHYTVFDRNIHLTWIVLILFLLLWFCAWFARRIVFLLLIANIGVIYFFCGITPEQRFHRTKWQEPWQVKPQAEYLPDGKIRIRNIRDFRYHNEQDYKIRYKDQVLDLNDLKYMELAISHWDGNDAIAHTMLIFHFSRWRTLVLSMETRIPQGQTQNGIAGLFKQYEIIPLIGTPEDLLDLRSKYRGEDLYIYRLNTSKEESKLIFTAIVHQLQQPPEFYNTLTRNCTTSLAPLLTVLRKEPLKDIRLLINGFSDKMMYQNGYLDHREGESFASLKSRSYVRGKNSGQ